MAGGLMVLAAPNTWAVHGPFAAPAVMKHWPPLVPQKQLVGSPDETQVAALAAKQSTTAWHSTWSAMLARPQQPSVPEAPSEQLETVQALQAKVGASSLHIPPRIVTGRPTEIGLFPSDAVTVRLNTPPAPSRGMSM